jgi:hypothetical protein
MDLGYSGTCSIFPPTLFFNIRESSVLSIPPWVWNSTQWYSNPYEFLPTVNGCLDTRIFVTITPVKETFRRTIKAWAVIDFGYRPKTNG